MSEEKTENGRNENESGEESGKALIPAERYPEEAPQSDEAFLVEDVVGRAPRYMLILMAGLCLTFIVWASFSKLAIFSTAQGEVVPSSKVKSVQHLEGGIVQRILVREGQQVKKDQPLVELQTTSSDADVRELNIRIKALEVEGTRLEAEFSGRKELSFSPEIVKHYPELVQQSKDLFQARRERLRMDQDRQKQLINQRQHEMDETAARLRNQKSKLTLLQEQVRISEQLLKDDLTNRYSHLELLKEENTLKSSIEENEAALSQAETALKGEEVRLNGILSTYNEEVQTALDENRKQYDGFMERARKYDDSLQRTILRAPVDGIIKTLYQVTEGGVIKPGETVLDIVPEGDRLIVEARLPTQDIGYIHPGQKAVIRLTSADARRFGSIDGEVVGISPDTLVSDKGMPYYRVRVATNQSCFKGPGGDEYCLYPGMIVQVNIHTGQRSVMEYLFSPFFYSMDSALTER